MPGIFLSLHPFFEGGSIMGRKEANKGFITALFRKDPFDAYHFIVENPPELIQFWQEEPSAVPLLARGALQAFPRTELENKLKNTPYSVCHFSDPMTEFPFLCRARNLLAPYIFPVTAVNHTLSYTEYGAKALGHIWAGCSPRDAIACTSQASENIMQALYNQARSAYALPNTWAQPQSTVIPLGVPNPTLGQSEALAVKFRERVNLPPNTILILVYGRISVADKMDLRPLFAALRRVRGRAAHVDFRLCIAGSMDAHDGLKDALLQLAKVWDIPFMLVPNPPRDMKKELFAAADIFVSPVDNIQETFGLTLVEAAQSALPVIASNWDGYRDIVVHEETGLLVPTLAPLHTPHLDSLASVYHNKIHQLLRAQQTSIHIPSLEQALLRLMQDETLRQDMGQKAAQRAAQLYTFDAVLDRWLDYWQQLAKTPICAEQEAELRGAQHPIALEYGKVFSVYASEHVHKHTRLCCTELGQACREKRAPWNNFALASVHVVEALVHALLDQCAQHTHEGGNEMQGVEQGHGQSVQALLQVGLSAGYGANYSAEELLAHIYWLLKQDLVEMV